MTGLSAPAPPPDDPSPNGRASVDQPAALVSVIIVNWNGKPLLQACLESLTRQSWTDFETLVVDNGSTDDSLKLVRQKFPAVRLLALDRNEGFSRANNLGIRQARGKYIAFLNNDTEADPAWLAELMKALHGHPEVGSCASKMLFWDQPDLADACGDFYSVEGVPGKIGHGEPAERYDEAREVFGACAGAAIYRQSVLEAAGTFDESFFMTHEDSDLSFRAQLMGFRCLYVPTAIVRHHVGATIGRGSPQSVYYSQRNTEFVYIKNMPRALLLKYAPLHLLAGLMSFASHLARGHAAPFVRAKVDALRAMPAMLEKRRQIQRAIRVPAAEIDRRLERGWLRARLGAKLGRGIASRRPRTG